MRATIGLTVVVIAGALVAAAAVQDEVVQAEKAWAAAVTKADVAALDRLLAPELIYTHSSGVVESRSVYFGRIKSGALKYESIEHEGITVKPYGDAAILHCKVRMKGMADGQPFSTSAVMIHVWVKQGGVWKLAAHQTTRLP